MKDVIHLTTEQRNKNTMKIDTLSTLEMVTLINKEDKNVQKAIEKELDVIAKAVDITTEAIGSKGRLIYMGAGTSGRLGVLDASEWLPTFGVGSESVLGLIAGGDDALRNPIEGAEDHEFLGKEDLKKVNLSENDVVCVIASSGRTPYCLGALKYAKVVGAKTISIANVKNSLIGSLADIAIEVETGPEVITGSTRLKAGSAQKMVLNILSTATMIKHGKVYGNLMVDVNPLNEKLVHRALNIIQEATGLDLKESKRLFTLSNNHVKTAIVMGLLGLDLEEAKVLLEKHQGRIGDLIHEI